MGIYCEIYLCKPSKGVYQPGQRVSGLIKYTVDAPTVVDKITTSLKGIGFILLASQGGAKVESTFVTKESYVDEDNVMQEKQNEIPVGTYEVRFDFHLPDSLPSSMSIRKSFSSYRVNCSVRYYIRIKFECPGFLTFNKHFRKEITVVSGVAAKLLREPVICGETKKLVHLFSSKTSNVNIKATIVNSALPFEGKVEVNVEVENNSHVEIKGVDTKLIEGYNFKAKGHRAVKYEKHVVPSADVKTSTIKCGETLNFSVIFDVPSSIFSIENTILTIVSRYYLVRVTARLPLPHTNAVLDIPVQIGTFDENEGACGFGRMEELTHDDAPPTYWEAMGESKKDIDDCDDDEPPGK